MKYRPHMKRVLLPVTRSQIAFITKIAEHEVKDHPNVSLLDVLIKDFVKAQQMGIFDVLSTYLIFQGWEQTNATWVLSWNQYDERRHEAPSIIQAATIQIKLEEGHRGPGADPSQLPFSSVLAPGRASGSLSITRRFDSDD